LSTALPALPPLPPLLEPLLPPSIRFFVPAVLALPPAGLSPPPLLVPAVGFGIATSAGSPLPALQCVNRSKHAGTQMRALNIFQAVSGYPVTIHQIEH
jgi:hypothetical protein